MPDLMLEVMQMFEQLVAKSKHQTLSLVNVSTYSKHYHCTNNLTFILATNPQTNL